MSDVTLSIGGRRYKLACAAGEEEHIAMLGRSIDNKLSALPGLSRQSETQTLLYVALLLADELHDRADTAQAAARAETVLESEQDGAAVAEPLERLAKKLETIAAELESAALSS